MENKIIIANMKMYMNLDDVNKYLDYIDNKIDENVILCPSSIFIPYFIDRVDKIGIQNIYYKDGAYTGEISPKVAHDFGVEYVIVGHSERRLYFNETDRLINKKVHACIDNDLKIILCIGENENELDDINIVLKQQLEAALYGIKDINYKNIIIAYEPRWAIGTNKTPSSDEISKTVGYIKSLIKGVKVVYGGSVNENNIEKLNKINNLDGFMIGASCVNPLTFSKIIEVVNSKTNI